MKQSMDIVPFHPGDDDIEKIGELYCTVFLGKGWSIADKENVIHNIIKHAGYQGFKGLKAKDGKGDITGFSYGYHSLPGQFYRGKIAEQLSEHEIDTWLEDCFEFVELAVHPFFRRRGIAEDLHHLLLDDLNQRTAVLTTGVHNGPAIHLYRKLGWEIIKKDAPVIPRDDLQIIMGKKLM